MAADDEAVPTTEESIEDEGGASADHPEPQTHPVLVAPTTTVDLNTIRAAIIPIACWRLDDLRFDFDSSFVRPEAAKELQNLAALVKQHKDAPASIFGHADPTGNDAYNKQLSGRRAIAIYGLVTRNIDLWEKLRKDSFGGDVWGLRQTQVMLKAIGFDCGNTDGTRTPQSTETIKDFQRKQGLKDDGDPGAKTHAKLFPLYMDKICVDPGGKPFQMQKADFLGKGADADGKGDYQGCSEFNPLLMFSSSENQAFQSPAKKKERDSENAPNRRVMVFLFRPGTRINVNRWPCPKAKDGTSGCEKRFWLDAPTRRQFQPSRRKFNETKDTFACRFYHRMATGSPCESLAPPLPIVSVCLKLTYLDPDGNEQPFPKDFPVIVAFGDGSTENHSTDENSLLTFTTMRTKLSFTLKFQHSSTTTYIAHASPETTDATKDKLLLVQAEIDNAIKDHFRVFKIPQQWSQSDSEWNSGGARVQKFSLAALRIGTPASPKPLVLNPHWQFLRFVYFDRSLNQKLEIPPVMVEGYFAAPGSGTPPDTHSNWMTADAPTDRCHALPWILRTVDRPDTNCHIQFKTPANSWIVANTIDDRKIEQIPANDARLKPGPDRLKFYDLPPIWKSKKYFTRPAGGGDTFYESLTAAQHTASKTKATAFVFSLDDIILTDNNLAQISLAATDTVAVFHHAFSNPGGTAKPVSDTGVWNPGADGTKQYLPYSDIQIPVPFYITDYPDWTRLVIAQGNLFDVFQQRTVEANDVCGARAGVRWVDGTSSGVGRAPVSPRPASSTNNFPSRPARQDHPAANPFFHIQPFFELLFDTARGGERSAGTYREWQSAYSGNTWNIGRFDFALLRCCDVKDGNEVAVNLHYFRFFFFFSAQTPAAANTPAARASFRMNTCTNIPKRWNAPDGAQNPDSPEIKPDAAADKIQVKPMWFAQSVPGGNQAHYKVDIEAASRAHMQAADGTGVFDPSNQAPIGAPFVAAHECGHADALLDEYNERWTLASYELQSFRSWINGDPYEMDSLAMMNGNQEPRARHYWHAAEWSRAITGKNFHIAHRGRTYRLPHHQSQTPLRTFMQWPLYGEVGITGAGANSRGRFDLYLYPLGDDPYRDSLVVGKAGFDGILLVVVKIRFTFQNPAPTFNAVQTTLNRMRQRVEDFFNGKFSVRGTVGPATFTKCLVYFTPRFVVDTYTSDNLNYLTNDLGFTVPPPGPARTTYLNNQGPVDYQNRVNSVVNAGGPHFVVRGRDTNATAWANNTTLNLRTGATVGAQFHNFFGDMVGLSLSTGGVLNKANVQTRIAQRAIPGGVVDDV